MPILSTIGAAGARGLGLTGGVAGYEVEYLVVGGGGSGGDGDAGGAGAGGVVTATGLFLRRGEQYTITVGASVPGTISATSNSGTQGNDSIVSGTGIDTITGGGGGFGTGGSPSAGDGNATNGSGGGCSYFKLLSGNGVGTGGDGGDQSLSPDWPSIAAPQFGAPGGGGASQDGGFGSDAAGGDGGDGVQSDIIEAGTDVWYGGGGGGKAHTSSQGAGGQGGGGAGSTSYNGGVAGGANTGGGGGGSMHAAITSSTSGAGGSGIVVLRFLSTNWSGTVTGSPTESTDGDYKVLKYTGNGTYTA